MDFMRSLRSPEAIMAKKMVVAVALMVVLPLLGRQSQMPAEGRDRQQLARLISTLL